MSGPASTPKGTADSPAQQPRWGIWTLAFLSFAFVMLVLSSTAGHYTLVTFLGLVIGLVGAGICTVKGLRALRGYNLRDHTRRRR